MQNLPKTLLKKMADRRADSAWRSLSTNTGLVDFSSNDYLGFAQNEALFSKSFQLLLTENIAQNGASGSRLLTGNHKLYGMLEALLSTFHEVERALVFNSGYDANMGFFGAVPQRGDLIFYDEHVHASIRDGIRMGLAKAYKFAHNNANALEAAIGQNKDALGPDGVVYVVTEAVFSMDGDSPDLVELANTCQAKGHYLVVDEAHAVGIYGTKGEGLVQHLGLQDKVFARIVTFGKAIGCHGAAILGTADLADYLTNFARSFVYTTGLAPHTLATLISAYRFLQEEGHVERERLKGHIHYFAERARVLGLAKHFLPSASPIQSCIVPGNATVVKVAAYLTEKGFDVKAIRSPTVPVGKERLRFCLHSTNSTEEMGLVLDLLSKKI
jgi:8-amino-7-oxononanoate synthase